VADPEYTPLVTLRRYVLKVMNIIDLIAILPFYIGFITPSGASLTIFRILRLGRILRLTKAGKNNSSMAVLVASLSNSREILLTLFFYVILCVTVIAALVYQFEMGQFKVTEEYPDGAYFRPTVNMQGEEVSPFVSVAAAIYWAIVTGTTVGYGDFYPTTVAGRCIASLWIFCGILVLGLPISIIGSNFSIELERSKREEMRRKELVKTLRLSRLNSASDRSSSFAVASSPQPEQQTESISANRRKNEECTQTPVEWEQLHTLHLLRASLSVM
jgi:hypothetical protein